MSERDRFNHKLVPYLINFVPFRINVLFDDFGSEELITHLDDAIRVWLSFYQATQKLVLPYQVLCLQKVNPQNTLQQKHTLYKYSVYMMCMWSVQVCHLWHGEAESGNLCIIYKWNSDFVWQHEKTVYDILNNAVTQTTVKDREKERLAMMLNIRTNQLNALNSIYPPIRNFFLKNMWYFEWQDAFTSCTDHFYYTV